MRLQASDASFVKLQHEENKDFSLFSCTLWRMAERRHPISCPSHWDGRAPSPLTLAWTSGMLLWNTSSPP